MWHGAETKAMINEGVIVGVGDRVGEYTVTDIQRDRVILKDADNEYELKLKD